MFISFSFATLHWAWKLVKVRVLSGHNSPVKGQNSPYGWNKFGQNSPYESSNRTDVSDLGMSDLKWNRVTYIGLDVRSVRGVLSKLVSSVRGLLTETSRRKMWNKLIKVSSNKKIWNVEWRRKLELVGKLKFCS